MTIRRFLDGPYLLSGYLAGLFLIAIFAMMMALSVGREFGINVKSGDDITAWCMAAMSFLGLAHTFKHGELIRMGLVVERLEGRRRWLAETAVLVLGAVLTGYLAWHAVKMTHESWFMNDLSNGVIVVPLWIPQLGFAVGATILFIAVIDELIRVARGAHPSYAKSLPKTREEIIERAASGNL